MRETGARVFLACVPYPAPHKPDMVMKSEIPVPWEGEAGRSGVQGHPCFHSVLEASLGYMKLSQTNKKTKPEGILRSSELFQPLLINPRQSHFPTEQSGLPIFCLKTQQVLQHLTSQQASS